MHTSSNMDKVASAPIDLSGNNVDSGASLLKKFRRVSVTGGTLKGARYSDVSETDIRKAARQYRGDPRFVQFCKQFVALETVSTIPEPKIEIPSQQRQPSKSDECSYFDLFCKNITAWSKHVVLHFRGRWLTFGFLVGCLLLILSRPSFGRLCGQMIGLTVRVFLRRAVGLLLAVIDSILDEVADQFESALLIPPEVVTGPATPSTQHSYSGYPQLAMHIICLVIGSLLGRTLPRVTPNVLPTPTP